MKRVKVRTTDSGDFAQLTCERVLLELSKDGDSPNCPMSWTWGAWFDGSYVEGTCDEMSLHGCILDAIESLDGIIGEVQAMREFLAACEVFGKEPETRDDE